MFQNECPPGPESPASERIGGHAPVPVRGVRSGPNINGDEEGLERLCGKLESVVLTSHRVEVCAVTNLLASFICRL
ncbi:hypothetical protein NDU88_002951 [Pleurodeles waltl]|uniref:Uncharacterized protein n=1 Tax=Pleurodeles waltl TaxID=8319 RepID=A0AAV7KTJ3_PLEWA|nr:hypothetical protein NDU88_002951 [Pleurodeles waltl]